jgi:hypothetical protein
MGLVKVQPLRGGLFLIFSASCERLIYRFLADALLVAQFDLVHQRLETFVTAECLPGGI